VLEDVFLEGSPCALLQNTVLGKRFSTENTISPYKSIGDQKSFVLLQSSQVTWRFQAPLPIAASNNCLLELVKG